MIGSGSAGAGVVFVALDEVFTSVDDELVSVVVVVGSVVGADGAIVPPPDVGATGDAASWMDAEFCGVNAPAGARNERSCVSALSG